MRIVLDAMGGDHAPQAIVEGAIQAAKEDPNIQIILVGIQDIIEKELSKYRPLPKGISVVHASEVVEMHEPATVSVRKKKDSSISRGVQLMKDEARARETTEQPIKAVRRSLRGIQEL